MCDMYIFLFFISWWLMLSIFVCTYLLLVTVLWWSVCSNRLPIFTELWKFLYILNKSPLSDLCFAYISSQAVTCLFIFLKVYFEEQKFLILINAIYQSFGFFFLTCTLVSLPHPRSQAFSVLFCFLKFYGLEIPGWLSQ